MRRIPTKQLIKSMWGNEYEIVVTTHLNTANVHNHFVVNPISFKTGRKFESHISDHYKLREISDAVCLEHGKGIPKDAEFYGGIKKEYRRKQNGGLSHREILKADIDAALAQSANFKAFEIRLKDMGYEIRRDENFAHYSVTGTGWQRAIRLDRLGKGYGVIPFTELHCILHKNILIWRQLRICDLYGYRKYIFC